MAKLLVFLLMLGSLGIRKDEILHHVRELRAGTTDNSHVPGFSYDGNSVCDKASDIYVRPSVSEEDTAIVRLSNGGSEQVLYRLSTFEGLPQEFVFAGFNVSPLGDLWEMVQERGEGRIQLFRFAEEQQAGGVLTLEAPRWVHPQSFAVSGGGNVFFVGYYDQKKADKNVQGLPFSAVFDASGHFIRTIGQNQGRFDPTKLPEGMIIAGDDNQTYILEPDRVLAYSASGDLAKEIKFEKPDPDMRATRLDISQGLLSIEFSRTTPKHTPHGTIPLIATTYLIINASDSRVIAYYQPDEEALGNSCLCFDRKLGYTFFRINGGLIELVHAPLH